jgi:hypothetical protein
MVEKLRPIDEDNLVEEWIRHSRLVQDYALANADATAKVEEEKAELDLAEAEEYLRIQESLDKRSKRVTEKVLGNKVALSRKVRSRKHKWRTAKHTKDVLAAMLNVLEHRKRALTKLVDLYAISYFGEPSADFASKEQMDTIKQRIIRRKGRRNRKK